MKLDGMRESTNVEDRRGSSGGGGGGLGGLGSIFGGGGGGGLNIPMGGSRMGGGGMGLGTIVIIGLVMWFVFGINPLSLLGGVLGGSNSGGYSTNTSNLGGGPAPGSADDERLRHFASVVFADTEDVWTAVFKARGQTYKSPTMVLYTDRTKTDCGQGQAAMGPFYCPLDQKVYLDLAFFNELSNRFGAPGDFAGAYVIAHEVGHHVQTLLGISAKVSQARQNASEEESNNLSVRLELQADCYAGVWAATAQRTQSILEPGDLDEALTAAAAVGDDTLQRKGQGYVVPESFTHGTSAQRQKWFKAGYDSANIDKCDTFSGTP